MELAGRCRWLKNLSYILLSVAFVLSLMGCAQSTEVKSIDDNEKSESIKRLPDKKTEVVMGVPSRRNTSYIPIYVALKKGYFEKYNLDVKLSYVQGGVLALRGLRTGDFQIISSLPESVITAVAEGANVKLIGTLDNQSMYSIYVAKDIKDLKELKGKNAAGMVPGNGTTIQLEYWLKKNGLDPNRDVRMIYAGDNAERLQAVQQGQAAVTILSPPTDLKADELGLKRYLMRDVLKTYNHNMLVTSGELIKNNPEIIYAFMSALADAVTFIKDEANQDEVVKILMDELEMTETDAEKSLNFILPALSDKGRINKDGLDWAINTTKEAGVLKKDLNIEQFVDERFYVK
ncbi:ABC transporter substrate-binding protein [Bacillaceae bacterium]